MAASTLAATVRAPAGPLDRGLAFFHWFGRTPWARRAILAVNLGGIAYGVVYYLPQFSVTPAIYWPLVPDSPLAVLWATLALLLYEFDRRSPALEGLAFVGNVTIGLWTAFVLLFYDRVHWPRLDFVLFWLHLGMIALALVFVRPLREGPRREAWIAVGAAALWYGANVWADYGFTGYAFEGCAGLHPISIHPLADPCAGLDVVAVVTLALTAIAVTALAVLALLRTSTRAPRG